MGEILTVDEVADTLKVHRNTVLRYLQDGELEGAKLKHEWRIQQEDLKKFLEERKPSQKQ